jgi:quinol monooxygenase YgiN
MVRMYVRHSVSDYDAFRKEYDAFDGREQMGVTSAAVYRSLDDPNEITVTHDFASADAARTFAAAPELRDAMGRAGVVGAPEIWFTEEV